METRSLQWKPVAIAPRYIVSNSGVVRNAITGTTLTQRPRGKWGKYLCVDLWDGNTRHTVNVHRLVAKAFLPHPPSDKHQVAHNDGNPENNRADNLRWATRKENMADCLAHGTKRQGEKVNTAKITAAEVREIRDSEESASAIAKRYGMTEVNVRHIRTRKTWKHIP